ncbi:MAG: uroporphyrinogen-III C-methyltransferase [Pseudomonadales bacterium]
MSDKKDPKSPNDSKRSSSIERAIASKGPSAPESKAPADAKTTVAPQNPDGDKWAKPETDKNAGKNVTTSQTPEAADSAKGPKKEQAADPQKTSGKASGSKVPPPTKTVSKDGPVDKDAKTALGQKDAKPDAAKKGAEKKAAAQPDPEKPAATGAKVPPPAKPAKTKSGRGLAFLSLLLALGAAGGAGYLYYELIYLKPFEKQLAGQMNTVQQAVQSATTEANEGSRELAQQLAGLEERFATLRGEQSSAIDGALSEQQQRLESTERSLIESLNKVANQAPPSQAEWKFAELEYLLRIANHRVLMEQDADGARRLLETADAIIAELDDFGLHDVRVQLADEILSLKRLGKNDVQGLFLRLEAVKRGLDGLPLRVPEFLNNPPTDVAAEGAQERGPLAALAESMGTFLQFRELETKIKPLLAPDEISYLELNLRLMLEQAQLGALRGQPDVFEQSLDNAMDWLTKYMDADTQAVEEMVSELASLREISVLRELPDISGSLRALLATERTAS